MADIDDVRNLISRAEDKKDDLETKAADLGDLIDRAEDLITSLEEIQDELEEAIND